MPCKRDALKKAARRPVADGSGYRGVTQGPGDGSLARGPAMPLPAGVKVRDAEMDGDPA